MFFREYEKGSIYLFIGQLSIIFLQAERMISQNIFIEQQRWNSQSHSLNQLKRLSTNSNPSEIQKYFTNKTISALLVKQMTNSQIKKVQGCIKSQKIKLIFKDKMKRMAKGGEGKGKGKQEIEMKISSKTNICDEEQQEVSQYFTVWEEDRAIA